MKKVKYLILGAGVSGLSFANDIGDSDYLIVEKESVAGGYCQTYQFGEYVWDCAGHFFHFSHPDLKSRFEEIISSEDTVFRDKCTKIYYKGYYIDYPFQKNIHQLSKDEMIDCLFDLFNKSEKNDYNNFLDMLYGKFGKSITEKFLKPYNEKLYACDLNMLDVEAMGRFFPYADIRDIVNNMKIKSNSSYNQTFMYPKNGAVVFVNKLLEGIDDDKICYQENVNAIFTERRVVVTNKDEYSYDYLISSIPMNEFLKMSDLNVDDDIFSYNQVLVFNLGFDKPAVDSDIHWIYVPDKRINFYRAGYYSNIIGKGNLSMYIEIGYPKSVIITEDEISVQLYETLKNLKDMGVINKHNLVNYQSIIMNPAYVHITQRGNEIVSKLKKELIKKDVHMIGRYGNWRYCSIEDCMLDSLETIRSMRE